MGKNFTIDHRAYREISRLQEVIARDRRVIRLKSLRRAMEDEGSGVGEGRDRDIYLGGHTPQHHFQKSKV